MACGAQEVLKRFRLREKAGAEPQTYALGVKEVWEVMRPPQGSHFGAPASLLLCRLDQSDRPAGLLAFPSCSRIPCEAANQGPKNPVLHAQ
jgi:hypothetical protein